MHQTTGKADAASPTSGRDHEEKMSRPDFMKQYPGFELVSELAGILTWEYDTETPALSWSPNAGSILGFPPPTSPSGFADVVHPDDRKSVLAGIMKWTQAGERFDIEHRIVAPETGRTIWLRSRAAVLEGADDTGQRLIGISQDITDYKQRALDAEFLATMQAILATTVDTEALLDLVGEKISEHLNLSVLTMASVSEPDDRMTLRYEYMRDDETDIPIGSSTPLSRFLPPALRQVLACGSHIAVDNIATDDRVNGMSPAFDEFNIQSALFIPHLFEGQWGMLFCANHDRPHVWRQQEIELLNDITERLYLRLRRAVTEHGLRQSEDHYRTLFNSIDEGFCVIEVLFDAAGRPDDYRFLETNPAFGRQTGMIGATRKRMKQIAPNHEQIWFEKYGAVALTGEPARFVAEARALGNRWFDVHAFRIGDPALHRVAIFFTDISERKQTEDSLRESEARVQRVIEIDSVGIIFFRPEGRVTYANQAFLRMSGYSAEDVGNGLVRWDSMTPAEWMPDARRAINEFLSLGRIAPYEKEYIRKDGSRWWGMFAASRINELEGVKFIIDITDLKLAEVDRARLADIVEGSNDAIIRCEPDGTIVDVNRATVELYGYTANEMIGQNIIATAPPDRQDEFPTKYALLLCGETVPPWESVRRRKDGTPLDVEIRMSPIQDTHGEIVGCSGIVRDVTERKRLAQAQEDFLAMASHDLRSPVTVLLGRAQLMGRRKAFDETSIRTIIDQARRIERLITDLQQVVHIESGKLELTRSRFDLAQLAAAAIKRLRLSAPTFELRADIPTLPVNGSWDRTRLSQVIDNLLHNAVKYSPDGGSITLQVSADDDVAQVQVSDHGVGIPPELQSRLFTRFYRADEAGVAAGLGLGLYISRMFIEAHGGTIQVVSTPDTGSTFTIRLPRAIDGDGSVFH